jgi:hypothetical protein
MQAVRKQPEKAPCGKHIAFWTDQHRLVVEGLGHPIWGSSVQRTVAAKAIGWGHPTTCLSLECAKRCAETEANYLLGPRTTKGDLWRDVSTQSDETWHAEMKRLKHPGYEPALSQRRADLRHAERVAGNVASTMLTQKD